MKELCLTLLDNFEKYLTKNNPNSISYRNFYEMQKYVEMYNCSLDYILEVMQSIVVVSKQDYNEGSEIYEIYLHPMQDVLNLMINSENPFIYHDYINC